MTVTLFREHQGSFGPYLRDLRQGRGLSLRDASGRLGMTFAKLQKMETGGRFRIDSERLFDAIAALYERPVGEVLAKAGVQFERPVSNAGPGIWTYKAGSGWSECEDILAPYELEAKGDVDGCMTLAGYGSRAAVYGTEGGFQVEVYARIPGHRRIDYEYLVWVNIGDTCEAVVCRGLPDLVGLLGELRGLTG